MVFGVSMARMSFISARNAMSVCSPGVLLENGCGTPPTDSDTAFFT